MKKNSFILMCLVALLCTPVLSISSKLPEQAAVNSQLETHDLKTTQPPTDQTILAQKKLEVEDPVVEKPAPPAKQRSTSTSFYGRIGDMRAKIDFTINYYINKCNFKTNIRLAKIVNLARILASFRSCCKLSHDKLPERLIKETFELFNEFRIYPKLRKLIQALKSKLSFEDIIEELFKSIWDEVDEEIEKSNLPIFIRRNIGILFDQFSAVESFGCQYPHLKDDDEIPEDWLGSQYIKVLVGADGEIDITTFTTKCQVDTDTVVVSPIHFDKGGILLNLWGRDSLFNIKEKTTVFSGYINNKEVVTYQLIPNKKDGLVNHQLTYGEKKILLQSKSKCDSFFFVLLSIQLDCDKYKVQFSSRFLASNSREDQTWSEFADRVEGLTFSFNKKIVLKHRYYRNFIYNGLTDTLLTSADIVHFRSEIAKSIPCNKKCKYSRNRKCILCHKPLVQINGKCKKDCGDGHYVDKYRRCHPCHKRCHGCHGKKSSHCIKCKKGYVRVGKKCKRICPKDMAKNEKGECVKCGEHCHKCRDYKHCHHCKAGTFEKDGKCVHDCGDGFYSDVNPNKCRPCHEHCRKCTNKEKCHCQEPAKDWALQDCKPVPKCDEGYYKDPVDSKCKRCSLHCKTCTDAYNCIKCIKGFSLLPNKTCKPKCPPKSASVLGICVQCGTDECDVCNSPNTEKCITCTKGLFLYENKCVKHCKEGTYEDKENGICVKCHQKHCKKCNEDRCIECKEKFHLFQNEKCVSECPDGYVEDGKKCVKCKEESKCKKCLHDSLETCTKCYGHRILFNGKCIEKCPKKYFEQNLKCIKCVKFCDVCKNSSECIHCDKDHLLKNKLCVEHCGEGYKKHKHQCLPCKVLDCESCDSKRHKCDKCKKNYFLYNNKCHKKCPPKTFGNVSSRICEKCPHDCEVCENKHTCKVCEKGKVLDGTECKDHCRDGYVNIHGVCTRCKNHHCKKCSHTNTNICVECSAEDFIYDGDCVKECEPKTYPHGKECKPCVKPCETCENRRDCQTCIKKFYLQEKRCVDNCDDGKVMKDNKCVNCADKKCRKCKNVGPKDCIKCYKGSYLSEGKCVEKCPAGQYHDDGICKPCLKHCHRCENPHTCQECNSKFFLKNHKRECVKDCGDGFVEREKECVECKKTCKKCRKDDIHHCTKCIKPLFLFEGNCHSKCESGTYVDEDSEDKDECKKCENKHCHRCTQKGKHCVECKQGFIIQEGKCIPKPCSEGYTMAPNQKECYKCKVEHCKTCPNNNLNKCIKCKKNYLMDITTGKCVEKCKEGTYKDAHRKQCIPCPTHCKTCTDATHCTSCKTTYSLHDHKCVQKCPPRTLSISQICVKCTVNECEECNPIKDCNKCVFPYLLTPKGDCVKKCKKGQYKKDGKCKKCELWCEKCKDASSCIKCKKGKFLSATNHCIDSCLSGEIEIEGRCVKCKTDSDCNKCCKKDLTKCVECKHHMVLKKNKCVPHCGPGYFTEKKKCKPCSEHCDSCENKHECHKCKSAFFLFRKKCIPKCEIGYRGVDGKCVECSDNCDKCDEHKCIKCHHHYFREEGKCVKKCTDGFYPDGTECKKCDVGCNKCKGPKNCIVCRAPKKLKNGLCVDKCGSGFATKGPNCVECSTEYCKNCDGSDIAECHECEPKHPLYKKKCVPKCPSGTFEKNNVCHECLKHCDKCHNKETCEKCEPRFVLSSDTKKCKKHCEEGYHAVDHKCVKCQVYKCHTCNKSLDKCKKCTEPFALFDHKCVDKCHEGTYLDINKDTNRRKCKHCKKECKKCTSRNHCVECEEGFETKNGKCIPKCKKGEFRDEDGKCTKCKDEHCDLCHKDKDECHRCKRPKVLYKGKCLERCKDGHYVSKRRECKKCKPHCEKCGGKHKCDKCKKPFVLQKHRCVPHCKDGRVLHHDECHECEHKKCKKCHSNLKDCFHCHEGYVLRNKRCVKICKHGEYEFEVSEGKRECRRCEDHKCHKCHRKDHCHKCHEGFYPYKGKCVKCEKGKVVGFDKKCHKCHDEHCDKCDKLSRKHCLRCQEEYFLKDGKCVKRCGKGYYVNKHLKKCEKCEDKKCLDCDGNNICHECEGLNVILPTGKCGPKCPPKYSPNIKRICVKCTAKKCLDCDGNVPESCIKCEEGYKKDEDGKCVKECKEDEYQVDEDKCRKCPHSCERCKDRLTCTKCKFPKHLNSNHQCVDKCKADEVVVKGTCVKCTAEDCHQCIDEKPTECDICKPKFYLYKRKCLNKCEDGTYPEAGKCLECDKRCKTCVNRHKCKTCPIKMVLQDGKCQKECDESYHAVEGICKKCKDFRRVKNCDKPIPVCKKHYYLSRQNRCVEKCDHGEMPDKDGKCVQCDGDKCHICESTKKCEKCKKHMVVLNGKCFEKCPGGHIRKHGKCVECTNPNCFKCQRENLKKCVECADKWFLYKEDCKKNCDDGTFPEKDHCEECDYRCKICKNKDTCEKCKKSFVLKDKKCVSKCGDGFYENEDSECKPCRDKENCETCDRKKPEDCIHCKHGYLFEKRCNPKCPVTYRADVRLKKCVPCEKHCDKCDEDSCIKCSKNNYFIESHPKHCAPCPKNDLHQIIDGKCVKCKVEDCEKCVDGDDKICKRCKKGDFLVDGKCIDKCLDGTYPSNGTCEPCPLECETCESATKCTKCKKNKFMVVGKGKCVDKCSSGFGILKNTCVQCTPTQCEDCDGKVPESCKKCLAPYLLTKEGDCVKHCRKGYYAEDGKCVRCKDHCSDCISKDKCITCTHGKKLKGKICVEKCGDEYYETEDRCIPCKDSNCHKCEKHEDHCDECKKLTYLQDKKCLPQCKEGYWTNYKERKCYKCDKGCKICGTDPKNPRKCVTCEQGLSLKDGVCVKTCPDGTSSQDGICVPCTDPKCHRCSEASPSSCIKCKHPYRVLNKKCVQHCPPGTHFSKKDHKCKECDKKCEECDKEGDCIKCKSEFSLYNKKCHIKCSEGQVKIKGKCVNCADSNCRACLSDVNICVDCKNPYVLYDNQCRIHCPSGFRKSKKGYCVKCEVGCESCPDDEKCRKCLNGYFLNRNGVCVKHCEKGQFGDCDHNVCKECNEACAECTDDSSANCAKCNKGFYHNDNSCVKPEHCRVGTFANVEKRKCSKCKLQFCAECSGAHKCTKCVRGYDLRNNVCVEGKSHVSVYGGHPVLFTNTEHFAVSKSFSSDLNGVGVGAQSVTFTFWIRVLNGQNRNSVIFETKSSKAVSLKLEINAGFCVATVNNGKTSATVKLGDCSAIATYNWKHFRVTVAKNGEKGSLNVNVKNEQSNKDYDLSFVVGKGQELVDRESTIEFNGSNANDFFEFAYFSVYDYALDSSESGKIYDQKPIECDYACKKCTDKCHTCKGRLLEPINGKCSPSFVSIVNGLKKFKTPETFNLKKHLSRRLDSDTFELLTWLNVKDMAFSNNLFTLYSESNGKEVIHLSLVVVNNSLKINLRDKTFTAKLATGQLFAAEKWYRLSFYYSAGYLWLTVLNRQNVVHFQKFPVDPKYFIRLHEDLKVKFNIQGTLYDTRFYVNNVLNDSDRVPHFHGLKCPKHCEKCHHDLTCVKCEKGKELTKDKTCSESEEFTPVHVLSKISIFNKEESCQNISGFLADKSTIRFCIRKRLNLDNTPRTHQLVNFKDSKGNRATVLTEKVLPSFKYNWAVDKTQSVDFNINQVEAKWQCVSVHIDRKANSAKINFAGKSFTTPLINDLKSICFGDANQANINIEVASVDVYKSHLEDKFLSSLHEPKDCDPACVDCYYKNGKCNKCITGDVKAGRCETYLLGYKSAYLYGVKSFSAFDVKSFTTSLHKYFNKDVNSHEYSVIGNFRILSDKFKHHADGIFTVFSLYETQDLDSTPYISLEVVNKKEPIFQWRVRGKATVDVVQNLEVSANQWISVFVTVNAAQGKIHATLKPTNSFAEYNNVFSGTPITPLLVESGTLNLFGVKLNPAKNYHFLDIVVNYFYLSTNIHRDEHVLSKFASHFPIPHDPVIENAKLSIRDIELERDIALACAPGFELKNNKCHSHKNEKYFIIFDENDKKQDGKYKYPIPSLKGDKNTLLFYFRQNYIPSEEHVTKELVHSGNLKITISSGRNGVSKLTLSVNGSPSTINFNGLDADAKKDYSWHRVVVHLEKRTVSLNVYHGQTLVFSNKIHPSVDLSLGENIIFNDSDGRISFEQAQIIFDDLFTTSVINEQINVESDTCLARGANKKCKKCVYGENGSECNSQSIKLPNVSGSSRNSFGIEEFLGEISVRSKDFGIVLVLEDKNYNAHSKPTTLFSVSNYQGTSAPAILSVSLNKKKLFVTYDNRHSESVSNSPKGFETAEFEAQDEALLVSVSLISAEKIIRVTLDTSNNSKTYEFRIEGTFENLGSSANVSFGTGFSLISHINFYYDSAVSHDLIKYLKSKIVSSFQKVCSKSTISRCNKCPAKYPAGLGYCLPTDSVVYAFNQVKSFSRSQAANTDIQFNGKDGESKYTIAFWYRINSDSSSNYVIAEVEKTRGAVRNDFLRVSKDGSAIVAELKSGSTVENTVRLSGLDHEFKQLDWVYIAVSVDLKVNKLVAYVYFEESGLGRFVSNTGKPFPSVINTTDKFVVNFGTSKSRFNFDISSVVVIRDFFNENSKFEDVRFRVPDSTNQHCLEISSGVCSKYPKLSYEDLGEASRGHGKFDEVSLKKIPLYNSLSKYIEKSTNNLRFQEYLISFKIQLKHCYSNEYKANSRVALSLLNINADDSLHYGDVISDEYLKYSALALEIRDNSLRLYAGGNKIHNEASFSEFYLGKDSFKSINNIGVQILINNNHQIFVALFIDDLKVHFKYHSNNAIEAISRNTKLFVNPFVSNVRLQVVDPRFSRDYKKYIEGRSDDQHTSASSLCSKKGANCEKCFLGGDSDDFVCSRCSKESALFNGNCFKKSN